jgi:hypothetical protein
LVGDSTIIKFIVIVLKIAQRTNKNITHEVSFL